MKQTTIRRRFEEAIGARQAMSREYSAPRRIVLVVGKCGTFDRDGGTGETALALSDAQHRTRSVTGYCVAEIPQAAQDAPLRASSDH